MGSIRLKSLRGGADRQVGNYDVFLKALSSHALLSGFRKAGIFRAAQETIFDIITDLVADFVSQGCLRKRLGATSK